MTTAVKLLLATATSLLIYACNDKKSTKNETASANGGEKQKIAALLDTLNATAARADYAAYFRCYDKDAIFMGTDATERWTKDSFAVWAKPFFDRGKAWSFRTMERNIYFSQDTSFAWFDELLNTQMKICRGSGVVVKTGGEWKLKQYVLSATIPNGLMDTIVIMKTPIENLLIKEKTGN